MDKYAVIENGVCTNIIVANSTFAQEIGAVEIPQGFGIGDIYKNGSWSKATPEPEPTTEERLAALEEAVLAMMEV